MDGRAGWPQAVRSRLATGDGKATDADWLGRTPLQLLTEATKHGATTVPTDDEVRRLLCDPSELGYERQWQTTRREVHA